jgi:hypothetical protein
MNVIDAPLFFQNGKAKEINDNIFTNTGCFLFLKIGEFPFINSCENYRQAFYSLIIDSYVLFHDYGRAFWIAFANVSNTSVPQILEDLIEYRILLTHSQFEPELQILDSFSRLITKKNITSIEDFYVNLSNANDNDYKWAYNMLKDGLNIFYNALNGITSNSLKDSFCNYIHRNKYNTFTRSLDHALIKPILQADSYNGNFDIKNFKTAQQNIIDKFNNNHYNTSDEIYPDFRNEVISIVNPPPQSSALLLNKT